MCNATHGFGSARASIVISVRLISANTSHCATSNVTGRHRGPKRKLRASLGYRAPSLQRTSHAFSSSSVVSRAFSALCAYSKLGHHPHHLGYLCAKFRFSILHCTASPRRKIAYPLNHWITQLIWCPGNRSFRFGTYAACCNASNLDSSWNRFLTCTMLNWIGAMERAQGKQFRQGQQHDRDFLSSVISRILSTQMTSADNLVVTTEVPGEIILST